jgi:hypothetical protein
MHSEMHSTRSNFAFLINSTKKSQDKEKFRSAGKGVDHLREWGKNKKICAMRREKTFKILQKKASTRQNQRPQQISLKLAVKTKKLFCPRKT